MLYSGLGLDHSPFKLFFFGSAECMVEAIDLGREGSVPVPAGLGGFQCLNEMLFSHGFV